MEKWQVSTAAAEVYDSCFVPAIFGAWAGPVAAAARIAAGDRVLDVACGTGVLTREARRIVGAGGQVVGLDLNDGMLAVAARAAAEIDWRQGDAAALPFAEGSFDVVVSQFGLMYFPDRPRALGEMWRVLAPGGRLAVAAWASLERARGYQTLVDVATKRCGPSAAGVLAAPFVLGDVDQLLGLFAKAGVAGANATLREGSVRFESVAEFVRIEVKGSPLAERLSDAEMAALASEAAVALTEFVTPTGAIVMPIAAHIVTAGKAPAALP